MLIYNMTTVVPGQYLVPEYKTQDGPGGTEILHYLPGKGAVVSSISVDNATIPVVVATLLGKQVIQEIRPDSTEKKEQSTEVGEAASVDAEKATPVRQFLVSVVAGHNEWAQYSQEVDALASGAVSATATNLPREGDVVLVKVTRINLRQANCEILCVYGHGNVAADGGVGSTGSAAHLLIPMGGGSQILSSYGAVALFQGLMAGAQPLDVGETFKGIIRSQDVRAAERDKVRIADCFRPGDLVKAVVLSLGDGSNYYLTTARNDLGVVFAKSEGGAGDLMVAVDWETMVCEKTGVVEKRKCAKLFD